MKSWVEDAFLVPVVLTSLEMSLDFRPLVMLIAESALHRNPRDLSLNELVRMNMKILFSAVRTFVELTGAIRAKNSSAAITFHDLDREFSTDDAFKLFICD